MYLFDYKNITPPPQFKGWLPPHSARRGFLPGGFLHHHRLGV